MCERERETCCECIALCVFTEYASHSMYFKCCILEAKGSEILRCHKRCMLSAADQCFSSGPDVGVLCASHLYLVLPQEKTDKGINICLQAFTSFFQFTFSLCYEAK